MSQTGKQARQGSGQEAISYERIVWLGMGVDVPGEWAMVRHATKAEKGRLVWMDRRHQRMQLSWLACASKPDMEQVLADYRNMDLAADEHTKFESMRGVLGWQGVRSHGKRCLTRAARYEAGANRWVEIVLEWPNGLDERIERQVCGGFEMEADGDTPRHWRAFGMDVTVAEGWELLRVDAKPADVSWLFSQRRKELIVRKLGMLPTWYDQNMRGFLKRQLGEQAVSFREVTVQGHEGIVGESREPVARIKRWLGKERMRRDWVWRCEGEDTLWQVTEVAVEISGSELAGTMVRCCGKGSGE